MSTSKFSNSSNAISGKNSNVSMRMRVMKQKAAVKSFTHDEFMAAAIGDTAWLKQSLKDGKDTSRFDPNGLAALHLAALHGRLECLKYLVESCGVDVNLPSSTGWRALHLAINSRTGRRGIECVEYLLENGADPSVFNDDKLTPSHQAAIEGSAKCLEALIAAGADINLTDHKGHTPLDYAKIWGHRICARLLASEGWKKDREIQAQQMMKMKFLKDQNRGEDIRLQEAREAEREFYGSISFSNWLDEKGLARKPTGPETVSRCHHHGRRKSVHEEKLHKPKSKSKPTASKSLPIKLKMPQTESNRTITPAKAAKKSKMEIKTDVEETVKKVTGSSQVKGIREMLRGDDLDGTRRRTPRPCESEEISELPQYMIDRLWLERMSIHDRPLNFRCQNIIDSQHKKLYEENQKPLVETYAHLSDCVESTLFPQPDTNDGRETAKSEFDVDRMTNAFKSWTRPGKFPAIKGSDYTYGFEAH